MARMRGVVPMLTVLLVAATACTGVAATKAKIRAAQVAGCTIRTTATLWMMNNPAGCPTVDDLKASKDLDPTFNSKDPFGSPYTIQCGGDDITVVSAGPDQKLGSVDDVLASQDTCK
jgi:hypothetical protein